MSWELSMILVALSVAANGFFAGAETGVTSARRVTLIHLERQGKRGAKLAAQLVADRESIIVSSVMGNNVAVVTGTALCTAAFLDRFGPVGEQWAALTMTVMNMLFGEILPKSWFRARPERAVMASAPILMVWNKLLAPARWIAVGMSYAVLRLLGDKGQGAEAPLSRERILHTFRGSALRQELEEDENALLRRFVQSSHLSLRQVMTPLADVNSLAGGDTVADAIALVRLGGHSRLPLIDATGQMPGWILVRDLLGVDAATPLDSFQRGILYLDADMGLDEGLSALTEARMNLAGVIGGDGRPLGIVTLEDVMEPLVGDIVDEHDPDFA